VSTGIDPVTKLHVDKAVDALVEEFGDEVPRADVERLMEDSVAQLVGRAEVESFVPTLAHRFARERLKAVTGRRLTETVADVLFVGLGDTGRGQMAAALLELRSGSRITAHSAGSTVGGLLDPAVVEVMAELEIDLSEAYAKPLSQEVVAAADVIVTMGRSVGTVQLPEAKRHEDWRVGDPTGAPVDEVRRVRDDIDRRVQELLAQIDAR
jgi:arsenate reductase (thioredoxin)